METPPVWQHHPAARGLRAGPGLAALLLAVAVGCGPVEGAPEQEEPATQAQELSSTNSETLNGLAFNGLGRSVTISLQGTNAHGQPIPTTEGELKQFSQREGCFFGNLFTNEGVFVGNDGRLLGPNESSVRACALSQGYAKGNACAPMVFAGSCAGHCTLDPTRTYFTQCTLNGITYVPLTTRIRPQEIYRCGDGICQLTESCGLGLSTTRCMQDCGTCP